MITPWLVLTMTVGVAALTARVLAMHPEYAGALLAAGAAACCVTLCACARPGRPGRPGTSGARG